MQLLDNYIALEKQIHEYFGYEDNWRELPLDDCRNYYWNVDEAFGVRYADSVQELETEIGNCYSGEFYFAGRTKIPVYRKDDYTMIAIDTGCDGNVMLMIFDNSKEIKELPETE